MHHKRLQWVFRLTHLFKESVVCLGKDCVLFASEFSQYIVKHLHLSFIKFESGKGIFVTTLYKRRGKYARTFVHTGMASLAAVGVMIAPVIAEEFPGTSLDPWQIPSPSSVLSASTDDPSTSTLVSEKVRDKIVEYTVQDGDTISTIADKFDIDNSTLLWQNDLTSRSTIKPGQTLEILPVGGVSHKVRKGDTIYSIAKKYDVDAQPIVNFPFNTFTNDETFELAIGQVVIVPGGVIQSSAVSSTPRSTFFTPDAGTVVASGSFVWPTQGRITQNFVWYHPGVDIANKAMPNVLAADSGRVTVAGWPDNYGYGNRIVIDHGNGYQTLYAHLSGFNVHVGQNVNRGDVIGRMGSTGRSTGPHLHFEVRRNGVTMNPLNVLQ